MSADRPHEARIDASVLIPFALFTAVWGSTWLVIRGQLGDVAPQWSVTYRFVIAAAAMMAVARWNRQSLRPTRPLVAAALAIGASQFCLNFNSVYLAERHITSGIVATVFALLLIPNSLLAWAVLGQRPTARFALGGLIAGGGIALLFVHEIRASPVPADEVMVGLGFTLLGMVGASFANVWQARPDIRAVPLYAMLAWSMAVGALLDAALALVVAGPPAFDPRPAYWAGLVYLALAASVLCFSLYFPVVRKIGPGRAAYSSMLVPVIAMALSTLFEGYRWSLDSVIGAGLVLAGMATALTSRARPRALAD